MSEWGKPEPEEIPEKQPGKEKKHWFNHYMFAFLIGLAGIILFKTQLRDFSWNKTTSQFIDSSAYMIYTFMFIKFCQGWKVNVFKKIFENSVAIAIFLGFVSLGFAIIWAIGQ